MKLLGMVLALLVTAPPAARSPHPASGRDGRVPYLEAALRAVQQTSEERQEAIYRYLSLRRRNACSSSFERLQISCLIGEGRRTCRREKGNAKKTCELVADVTATSILAESRFVSAAERYEIMRRHPDFRTELRRVMRRIYGQMATDFFLSPQARCAAADLTCLAGAIDDYCRERADLDRIPWQYCSAALVGFIGSTSTAAPAAAGKK